MTVEKELPGVWVVCCDFCGERHELDTDPDDSFLDAIEEVKSRGYMLKKESQRYHEGMDFTRRGRLKQEYWTHKCKDCKESDQGPSLADVSSMSDQRIEIQQSRPYRLGYEAGEIGIGRLSNPMKSDSGRARWDMGYDDAERDSRDRT